MNMRLATTLAITAVLLGLRGQALAQPACGYEVVIVHPDPCGQFGPPSASGQGINAFGHVAGHHEKCSDQLDQAFYWTPRTGMVDLEMPAGTNSSEAADIEGTRIVGTFDLDGDGLSGLGFVYDSGTAEFTNLGTLPGGTRSEAFAVNSAGQIAGYWGNKVIGPWQTFIWENGEMIDLGPSIGGLHNRGFDINEAGAITGWAGAGNVIDSHAFIWENGKVIELPFIPDGFTSEGRAINNHLDVVGWGRKFDEKLQSNVRRAFLWTDGRMIDLGVLPGRTESFGYGVNDAKQVIGLSWDFGSNGSPFIWQDGVITDLNDLVPPEITIGEAWAINNAGEIAGSGRGPGGGHFGMALLIPNPRPLGDLDMDCAVGVADLLMLLGDWGPCENCEDCRADLDGDCSVGVKDLLILLGNWG